MTEEEEAEAVAELEAALAAWCGGPTPRQAPPAGPGRLVELAPAAPADVSRQ